MSLFQTLDEKKGCELYYHKGDLHDNFDNSFTHTWKYVQSLKNKVVEYAYLYSQKDLDYSCPEEFRDEWFSIKKIIKAHKKSIVNAKIDLNNICFYDLIPNKVLIKFCEAKNIISQHVFDTMPRPVNYDFLLDLEKILLDIKFRPLNIDYSKLPNDIRNLHLSKKYLDYDPLKHKTGRLVLKNNSFPVMNLKKDYRNCIRPYNQYFIELDYNAADLRVLLGLLDIPQPEQDLHDWVNNSVFHGMSDRQSVKQKVFSWLYNPNKSNHQLGKFFDRDSLKEQFFKGNHIINAFDRKIDCDEYHCVNYVNSSTLSDLFLRQVIKVNDLLKDRKSFISILMHDSILIDFNKNDKDILENLIKVFSDTCFGEFKTNLSIGKDWGNMERVNDDR